jgi:hypothetical protein
MKDLKTSDLTAVVGGTRTSDLITQQLTSLTSQIKDAATNNNSSTNNLLPIMMMALAFRPQQPTVVAAAPAAPAYYGGGPIINVSTRFRRWG